MSKFPIIHQFIYSCTEEIFYLQIQEQKQILSCMALGIGHRELYPPNIRQFCITLKNISPAAYRFVRNEFDNHLPHIRTIVDWHANSNINCEPGIMKNSIDILRRKVAEKEANGEKLFGALLFDEMGIRKHVQYVNGQMLGFENIPDIELSNAEIASEALVFMVSTINDKIRLPVAYYFVTKKMDAATKMALLKDIIKQLLDIGIELACITFDGLRTNPSMCRLLGADLDVYSETFDPFFCVEGKKIGVVFDFSHVMKLVRNILGTKKILFDANNNAIKWDYFEKLVAFKDSRNFEHSHKMTQAHIQWKSNPMKVRLAVETLSASTAYSMEFLMKQGHTEFAGAGPTINFIRNVNDLFDICNTTDCGEKSNPLKNPMSANNAEQISQIFQNSSSYIKGLQLIENGQKFKLCNSISKTGYQGFLVNMEFLAHIYNEIVVEKKLLTKIPTHTMSQDHLEILFGKLRSLNGFNNNPTCQQFNAALRKIMANTAIMYSKFGNCSVLNSDSVCNPYSNIVSITSRRAPKNKPTGTNVSQLTLDVFMNELAALQNMERVNNLTDLSDFTVSHIAGMIESQVLNSQQFPCHLCKAVLMTDSKIQRSFLKNKNSIIPCQSTFEICTTADHFVKIEVLKGQFKIDVIHRAIIQSLECVDLFRDADFLGHEDHKLFLIKHIVDEFVRIKGVQLAKKYTFKENQIGMRQKLSKLILHHNQ